MIEPDHLQYDPWPSAKSLARSLERSISTTLTVMRHLQEGQENVALLPNVNPPHWEFGHLIWFHEFWVHREGKKSNPSSLLNADELFDSSAIFHDDRWQARIPSIDILKSYLTDVMDLTLSILESGEITSSQSYFIQLSIFHQDMHNEAFAYTWQHLAYAWPDFNPSENDRSLKTDLRPHFINVPSGQVQLGSFAHHGFMFDNEKWQHALNVPEFSISSHAVSNGEFLAFLLSQDGAGLKIPEHWKKEGEQWFERHFNVWSMMEMHAPVRHVSALDAEHFCAAQGLRLPTEAQLTALLLSNPQNWQCSKLWEWTSSVFEPFEGFSPDPYQDYSKPWFDGQHRVLKGWSPFTSSELRRPQFRNFYLPTRSDPFCGFRTCLL